MHFFNWKNTGNAAPLNSSWKFHLKSRKRLKTKGSEIRTISKELKWADLNIEQIQTIL